MVLDQHLVVDLRMNEGSGLVTLDRSKNDALGTFGAGGEAPSWDTGKDGVGKAISFDGGDILTVNDLLALLATLEVGAIEIWCKIDADVNTQETQFSISRDADATQTELWIAYDTRGGIQYLFASVVEDGAIHWTANTAIDTTNPLIGVYAHFVLAQDGTEPVFYINGLLYPLTFTVSTDKTAWLKNILTDAASKSDVVTVGEIQRNGALVGVGLTGDVQVLRMYNAVPSPQQVRAMHSRGV